MDIGSGEILLILLFALLLYGGRLPEVARSVGRSIAAVKRSFMESSASVTEGFHAAMDDAGVDVPERPRTVKRIEPVPEALAKEDISAGAEGAAAAPAEDAGATTAGVDGAPSSAPASPHPPASPQS